MINGLIHHEAIGKYIPNNRASKYGNQKLTEIKWQINKSTIVVGDFNTLLSIPDGVSRSNLWGYGRSVQHLELTWPNQYW